MISSPFFFSQPEWSPCYSIASYYTAIPKLFLPREPSLLFWYWDQRWRKETLPIRVPDSNRYRKENVKRNNPLDNKRTRFYREGGDSFISPTSRSKTLNFITRTGKRVERIAKPYVRGKLPSSLSPPPPLLKCRNLSLSSSILHAPFL